MNEVKLRLALEGAGVAVADVDKVVGAFVNLGSSVKEMAQESSAASAGQSAFMTTLRDQVATTAMSAEALMRYRAAQAGVGAEAAPLILQLENIRAAMAAKATEDMAAAAAARAQAASLREQAASQQQFIATLRDQVATQGMSSQALMSYRAAQLGVSTEAEPLIQQLTRQSGGFQHGAMSAAQLQQSMRYLPKQFDDAFRSLAAGQAPMAVLFQQGSQLRDMFGGFRPALAAIGSLFSPVVVGALALAAPFAIAAFAMYKGRQESDELGRSLQLTGNYAGISAGQFADMAARNSASSGTTIGSAKEILMAAVATGNYGARSIGSVTAAMSTLQAVSGGSADEVAADFASMSKGVAAWAAEHNRHYAFITKAEYDQIALLAEQGRTEEAMALAADKLTEAIKARSPELNAAGKLWKSLGEEASRAWDKMMGLGRADSPEQKLAAAKALLAALNNPTTVGNFTPASAQSRTGQLQREQNAAAIAAAEADVARLTQEIYQRGEADSHNAEAAAKNRQAIADEASGKTAALANADIAVTLARDKAAADAKLAIFDASQTALDTRRSLGLVSERQAADASTAIEVGRLAVQRGLIQQQIDLENRKAIKPGDDTAARMKAAAVIDLQAKLADVQSKIGNAGAAATAKLAQQMNLGAELQKAQELNATYGLSEGALLRYHAAKLGVLASSDKTIAAIEAERDALAAKLIVDKLAGESMNAAIAVRKQYVADMDKSLASVRDAVQGLKDEEEAAALAAWAHLSLSQAVQEVAIAHLQEKAAKANPEDREALSRINAEIAARRELIGLTFKKESAAGLDAYLGKDPGLTIADGFDKASQSLAVFVGGFKGLMDITASYDAARKAAAGDPAKMAAVEAQNLHNQVNAYGTLAGAAKGFFAEGSRGYAVLAGAEKAFRALELGLAIESAAEKMGLMGAVTAAKVADQGINLALVASGQTAETALVAAGQAEQNAAKVPGVFMAFMSALGPWGMAAAGVAIAAVMGGAFSGGGGGSAAPTNTGTGTVFGDSTAKSESITKALELLNRVDTMTMNYSALMAASLHNIEGNIGGLSNLIVRSGGVAGAAEGIQTGHSLGTLDKLMTGGGSAAIGFLLGGPVLALASTLLSPLVSKLFGSSTSINGQGITAAPQTLGSIASAGQMAANYYADTQTKKKFLGITYSNNSDTQQIAPAAGDPLRQQFALILTGFADTVRAAAGPLGVALGGVESKLSGFVVDIGKIDLKDLTGTQIQDKLSAVFGAAGDNIAAAALPGFERFAQVGEGYLQTVVRVATGAETAQMALEKLGVSAVSLAAVVNAQGDIGAELVRQSVVAAEAAGSGIAQIIASLSGTATDIATAYASLTGVRDSLVAIGASGAAVSTSLLRGAGSLQALQDALKSFQDHYLSDSERLAIATASTTAQFERLGFALPASGAAYVALVRGIDTSTEAGQKLLGQVLALSDGFSVLADHAKAVADERLGLEQKILQAQGNTAELRQRELAALDPANRALQQTIYDFQDLTAVATDRMALDTQLVQLQGRTDELRRRQLAAMAPENRDIQQAIYDLTDAKAAADALANSAAAAASTRAGLEKQLLQLQGDTAALRAQELAALDPANAALQQRIYDLTDEKTAQDALSAASAAAAAELARVQSALASAGQGIAAYIAELAGNTAGSSLAQARATYNADLAAARGGDADASGRIVASAKALVSAAQSSASDPIALARETSRIATELQALPATVAWQAQLLTKLDTVAANTGSGGAVAQAVAQAGSSLSTAVSALATPAAQVFTFDASDPLRSIFEGTKSAAESQLAIWQLMANGSLGIYVSLARAQNADGAADIGANLMRAFSAWGGGGMPVRMAAFAAGGSFSGGLRLVGENGPEIEATGPARYWNAAQTAGMLAGAPAGQATGGSTDTARLEALVQQLTAEVEGLRAEARATATHTAKTSRLLTLWDGNGLTVKTDADTPLAMVAA